MTIENMPFSAHPCASGWYAGAIRGPESESVESDAVRIQQSALERGYFAVCGLLEEEDGYRLFLAPSNDAVAVARVFGVGKHGADYDPEGHSRAMQEIENVHRQSPIIPFFADTAGFKARFSEAVTDELITFLGSNLTDAEPMMDDEGSIEEYVKRQKGIHLWWD